MHPSINAESVFSRGQYWVYVKTDSSLPVYVITKISALNISMDPTLIILFDNNNSEV